MSAWFPSTIKKGFNMIGLELRRRPALSNILEDIPEISNADQAIIEISSQYSMAGHIRQWSLLSAVRYISQRGLDGDLVECGVWRGGNLILMKLAIENSAPDEHVAIWGFDTFAGMTEPTEFDRSTLTDTPAKAEYLERLTPWGSDWCYSSIEEVEENLAQTCGRESVTLVKGPVEETLADGRPLPESISLLRIDTDWYESTRICLEVLFPRLVPGGILILDDYGYWSGARKAVDEYFAGESILIHRVDHSCRLIVKGTE
jgi:O-methyltransferase